MGLASKLAAANRQQGQQYGGGGAPPYPTGPQAGGGPPQQQQYQAYPGGGQPPPPGQGPSGGRPPQPMPSSTSGPQATAAYREVLNSVIREKNLGQMFPPNSPYVEQIASKVNRQVDELCQKWRVPREVGQDVVKLALFDIILYIDDSGSMAFEEDGERIKDLRVILSRVAYAAALFDANGIELRFMNNDFQANRITTEQQVEEIVNQISFKGLTPLGTSLKNKVLEPLVLGPARRGQLTKPVLVITITDGQPAGEPTNAVFDAIKDSVNELRSMPRYGAGVLSFQFAQVGNDLKAREFLAKLDNDPTIGNLVDCTSNFEVEQDEMSRSNPPVDLTPELWLAKLLLGAIDSSYDTKDEGGSARPPPQQQSGGPGYPQNTYPGGQGGYGQQPPYGGQQPPYGGQHPPYSGQNPPYGGQQGHPQGGNPGGYGQPHGGYGGPPIPPRY